MTPEAAAAAGEDPEAPPPLLFPSPATAGLGALMAVYSALAVAVDEAIAHLASEAEASEETAKQVRREIDAVLC